VAVAYPVLACRDEEEMALPEAVRLAHLQSAEEDRMERMLML